MARIVFAVLMGISLPNAAGRGNGKIANVR
jgi:hypothetical protein